MKKIAQTLVGTALIFFVLTGIARAQTPVPIAPVSPQLGGCFGTADLCIAPDLSFNAIRYDLVAKKLSGGALPVGIGYALLFGYSQWWASGVAVHALVDLTQAGTSYIEPSAALTIFRYLRLGAAWRITDGAVSTSLIAGFSAPVELLTAGTIQAKATAAANAAAAAAAGSAATAAAPTVGP